MAAPRASRRLGVAAQALALRRDHPDAVLRVGKIGLIFTTQIQPTALSLIYRVRISYDGVREPKTTVLNPVLAAPAGKPLPHVYSDGSLCLYDRGEWHHGLFMADTIVGWAAEWLAHYELWQMSGQWYGDVPPPMASDSTEDP
jgi:hypothetical protein